MNGEERGGLKFHSLSEAHPLSILDVKCGDLGPGRSNTTPGPVWVAFFANKLVWVQASHLWIPIWWQRAGVCVSCRVRLPPVWLFGSEEKIMSHPNGCVGPFRRLSTTPSLLEEDAPHLRVSHCPCSEHRDKDQEHFPPWRENFWVIQIFFSLCSDDSEPG